MSRINNQPPVGGPNFFPPENSPQGQLRDHKVRLNHHNLNLAMQVAPRSGSGKLQGRAKPQDTATFITGTNFALRHMWLGN